MANQTIVNTVDLTGGGRLAEAIVGVSTTTLSPGAVHGITYTKQTLDTSLVSTTKSTDVNISNTLSANTSNSVSTSSGSNTSTWTGVAPFIRSREITIKSFGLMPNRIHYPFMDNVKINTNCKTYTRLTVTTTDTFDENVNINIRNGVALVGTATIISVNKFYNESIIYIKILTGSASVNNTLESGAKTATINEVIAGNVQNPSLTSDKYGGLVFSFNIPQGIFKTGTRQILLSDVNDPLATPLRSSSAGFYSANGTIIYQQTTITNTVVNTVTTTITNTTNKVTTNNITNNLNRVVATTVHYNDPLAQTFIVSDTINPSGIFVSSIDLYFKNKPDNPIPLTVQLRNVVNGLPVSFEHLTGANKKIMPSDVTTSTNGSVATNIKFDSPVYLTPGEYAIVLISNADEYEVFVAEMGKKMIGTNVVISEPPAMGVLLKSTNASTWTPVQEMDLTFRINKAVFNTSGTVRFDVDHKIVNFNGNITTGNPWITNIIFDDPVNNIFDLYLNYIIEGTGIPLDSRVIEIDKANLKIKLDNNVTATTTSVDLKCYPVIDYSLLSFNCGINTPTGTETSWSVRALNSNTNLTTTYNDQLLGVTKDFKAMQEIIHPDYNSGTVPLRITGTFTTANPDLSPVISTSSFYAKTTKNIINNDSDYEATPNGGHADSVYFTRKVALANEFDASNISVTFDAFKPTLTDFKVYYKALPLNSSASFESNSWVEMTQSSVQSTATSDTDFREYNFVPVGYYDQYGVPKDDPINPRFSMFAIKIVMLSSDKAYTPIIRNLRAIALDS